MQVQQIIDYLAVSNSQSISERNVHANLGIDMNDPANGNFSSRQTNNKTESSGFSEEIGQVLDDGANFRIR